MSSGIYEIKCNDKFYVGSAANFDDRWKEHNKRFKLNDHANYHLRCIITQN